MSTFLPFQDTPDVPAAVCQQEMSGVPINDKETEHLGPSTDNRGAGGAREAAAGDNGAADFVAKLIASAAPIVTC